MLKKLKVNQPELSDYNHFVRQTEHSLEVYLCCTGQMCLNLPLTSWPRGARLKLQENSYKHLCKGHIFSSTPTLGTSSPSPLGSCGEDRADSFPLFLHLCDSAHGKLFCRDRLSLLTAIHPLRLQ